MFVEFFFELRERDVPVGLTEWLTLMEALGKGLAGSSLLRFYHLSRAICVKSETHFDRFDQAFAHYFKGIESPREVLDDVIEWLEQPIAPPNLSAEDLALLRSLDLDDLRQLFEERLKEQTERHDGGSRWIGTGGTSPFGHGGINPTGVRVGGQGGGRTAMQVASQRRFRNLRSDLTLDVRQISMALRRLRKLRRDGRPDELDLDGTIDATARNAGDLELIFRSERKNTVKLLLLMDVGGSMTPYTRISERVFSAAHSAAHFKRFKHFFFHNCVYERMFDDMWKWRGPSSEEILESVDESWLCIIVGDAAMGPHELTAKGGSIDYFHQNDVTGLRWLERIRARIPRSVWLNPEPKNYWGLASTAIIRRVFPMFPLTLDGLDDAVQHLRRQPH